MWPTPLPWPFAIFITGKSGGDFQNAFKTKRGKNFFFATEYTITPPNLKWYFTHRGLAATKNRIKKE